MNSLKNKVYISILITLLVASIFACQNSQPENASQTDQPVKTNDQADNSAIAELITSLDMHYFTDPVKAPEFELASVKGGRVSLSQHNGNVVFLSFWATW
jgi:hypothetical protein